MSEFLARSVPVSRRPHHGSVMVYGMSALIVMVGVASLAVEFGQVQYATHQLEAATDAAALYAASGVKHQIDGVNASIAMARASLAENTVNGKAISTAQSTIETGVWNRSSRKFKTSSDVDKINAVRVTVNCDETTDTLVQTPLASLVGKRGQRLTATAVALYDAYNDATMVQKYVPATSNPFLAGSPAGTIASVNNPHNSPDYAGTPSKPRQSPVTFEDLQITPGKTLTFDGVNGGANNMNSDVRYTGDGNLSWIVTNDTVSPSGGENGKSNLKAPINSVVAVFLSDAVPSNSTSLPPALDFSTSAQRDFATLKPMLNQTFFIGDGRRNNGELQRFVIPAGATRVIIGTMDGYEWNNNVGGFTVTATSTAKVVLVQ